MFVIVLKNKQTNVKTVMNHNGAMRVFDSRKEAVDVATETYGTSILGDDHPTLSFECRLMFSEDVGKP